MDKCDPQRHVTWSNGIFESATKCIPHLGMRQKESRIAGSFATLTGFSPRSEERDNPTSDEVDSKADFVVGAASGRKGLS